MTHVFHRSLLTSPPKAARGDGMYVVDTEGRRYLDACGGAAVSCLGHNHPAVVAAIDEQLSTLPYAHTTFFTTDALEKLGSRLVEQAPGMGRALFVCGGSEAMEAALKLSRQYFVECGQPKRRLFIARQQSYHGNTLGVLAVGGNEWRRRPFEAILPKSHHIAACYAYRGRKHNESSTDYGRRVANELESKILEMGADNVAAFVAETVVGATLGAAPAVAGYFTRVREICDTHGIHLILDEVMCGSGRTGTYFAYEQEGIVPDIVALAKGLAAGYQPIGAMLCRADIAEAIRDGSGFFQHGHTFMGHATAMAAALATLDVIRSDDLMANVEKRGSELQLHLKEALSGHANVGDIRGRGLFVGIEFVENRDTQKPFDPLLKVHKSIQSAAMAEGLLCYAMGGTVDGRHGDHILIAPPYIAQKSNIEEIVNVFAGAVVSGLSNSRRTA